MYFNPNEENPRPGEYKLNFKHTLPSPPKYTMGVNTAIWFDYDKPKPKRYNVRQVTNNSPKYTMGQHLKPIISPHVLGPKTYPLLLHGTHMQVPGYTMQGPTKYNPFQMIPGMGSYNVGGKLGGISYTMGKHFQHKPSLMPGPSHYSPKSPANAPAYTISQHIDEFSFLTPGLGAYNVGGQGKIAPTLTMGQHFVHFRDKLKDKRYHGALKQWLPHRSAANFPSRDRTTSQMAEGGQPWMRPASPPLMIAPSSTRPRLSWTRPSTWDITAPPMPNPRRRPMTSFENILHRIHFKIGPTQNAKYNEYIREMHRYIGNKGVCYGQVSKWGTSKSFIHATYYNKSFIGNGEL